MIGNYSLLCLVSLATVRWDRQLVATNWNWKPEGTRSHISKLPLATLYEAMDIITAKLRNVLLLGVSTIGNWGFRKSVASVEPHRTLFNGIAARCRSHFLTRSALSLSETLGVLSKR